MRANLTWSGRSRPIAATILLLLDVAGAPGAAAEDWPKWRGPNGDGVSTESGWQSRFPAGGPRVLWQRDVGFGYAAVAVSSVPQPTSTTVSTAGQPLSVERLVRL